jgi:hypothetical protein
MKRVASPVVLAVWLVAIPARAQLYRNETSAPRGQGAMGVGSSMATMGPPATEAPQETTIAAPQPGPVVVPDGPVPVWDGGRFATSLLINNVYGVGLRVSYDHPLARRLFGGHNALTLGAGLSYFHNYDYRDYGCYSTSYADYCNREGYALGLSTTLGWRFGVGQYLELGPRTSLALWFSSQGGLMVLGGVGGSVRASRDSGLRFYFDLDFGHSDSVGGAMVMLGLGIGWGRGAPVGARPAPTLPAVTTATAVSSSGGSTASAVHTGWRWTLSAQAGDGGLGVGPRMGLSLPLANHVLSDSSAITLGVEASFFPKAEALVAAAHLGWRFGLGQYFELEPRLGIGLWDIGQSNTALVTAGSRLGIRPSVQSGFRIVLDNDVSQWHRSTVIVASVGIGYAF